MAFTCGFFNSQNGDRKYNAEQMASIFDGLIKDGVYDTVGDIFAVTPGTGMQVLVGSGRAWFDHTWNNNDAPYPLAITAADVSLPRYDAVVLETNHSDTVRTNRLRVLTGTPARNPVKPTMTSTANVKQHPLAYIKVTAGATAITQSMIQVVVGTSECPFVTGIIDTAQIDALFQQWNGEFNEWFDNLKAQLSDNVVANLQGQIDQKVAKADVATTADIKAGTSTTKWVTPKGLKDFNKNVGVYDQTTGQNIKLQTGIGLVGVEHHVAMASILYGLYSNNVKPFWVYDKYIAYCGCMNTGTNSSAKYNPSIFVIDAEACTEYFSKTLSNLNVSSTSHVGYSIDSVCNGKGFHITNSDGWGYTYDHEKKTFIATGSLPSGINKVYNKIGFTDNYIFRYDRSRPASSTVYYMPRNGASSFASLSGSYDFSISSYGFIYAGYKGDCAYIAYFATSPVNARNQISIYKFDFKHKTVLKIVDSSDYILSNINIMIDHIMTDDTSAYFILEKDGTNMYSKVLKFNYINETWNMSDVLNSNLLPSHANRLNYIGTVGDTSYVVPGSPGGTIYHFDKTNLQIYAESTLMNYGMTVKLTTINATSEIKFDKCIIIGNGYFDPSTMTYKLTEPCLMPSSSSSAVYGVLTQYNENNYKYGSIIHEGIVSMPIFLYRPPNSSVYEYPDAFFGKIQPMLLNKLA